jgi:1-acyl-sn-glycerol-3-phosphate acyltransferase
MMDTNTPRPPDYPAWLSWFARTILGLFGWQAEGHMPNIPKFVVIGAHHTSNLDGFLLVGMSWVLRTRLHWLGKHTLFRAPFGPLMRAAGGIPVNRKSTRNAVEQVAQAFEERDKLVLVIAPEGTRKKVDHWKTGFYYIALKAQVPIAMGYMDYRRKRAGIGPVFMPTGDIEADMKALQEFYATVTPRYPDQKGAVALPERHRRVDSQ